MNNCHHATLLKVNSPDDFELYLETYTAERQIITIEKFGIDDARQLVRQAYQRPVNLAEQLLVVTTDFITHEAQNALLKVLEEPPLSTKFLFVVPADFMVLPTLASRFHCITASQTNSPQAKNISFTVFLTQPYSERLSIIEAMLKKEDKIWQRAIKRGLIVYTSATPSARLSELEYVARTLLTRGASNKMLLEHAALALPVS